MSKDIPKQVRRLFGISFTPILPIYHSKPKTGFVSHDPFKITTGQHFSISTQNTRTREETKPYIPQCSLYHPAQLLLVPSSTLRNTFASDHPPVVGLVVIYFHPLLGNHFR
jgi:hypothetical protein